MAQKRMIERDELPPETDIPAELEAKAGVPHEDAPYGDLSHADVSHEDSSQEDLPPEAAEMAFNAQDPLEAQHPLEAEESLEAEALADEVTIVVVEEETTVAIEIETAGEVLDAADGEAESESEMDGEEKLNARPEELRLLEAMLFASKEPLDEKTLAARMPQDVDVKAALDMLKAEYLPRGVNLVRIGGKWTFRTASDLGWLLTKEAVQPRKLSRAAIETLAVIAYHQPVTRAEIEEIRGVTISKGTLDVLLETGWVRPRGRRKVPGRPITYGTSEEFISHFGLEQLGDLPGLDELKGSGLLDGRLPPNFTIPVPSDDPALREDEDPLEPGDLDLGLAPRPEAVED
jgi:segregation and condensation protein B